MAKNVWNVCTHYSVQAKRRKNSISIWMRVESMTGRMMSCRRRSGSIPISWYLIKRSMFPYCSAGNTAGHWNLMNWCVASLMLIFHLLLRWIFRQYRQMLSMKNWSLRQWTMRNPSARKKKQKERKISSYLDHLMQNRERKMRLKDTWI